MEGSPFDMRMGKGGEMGRVSAWVLPHFRVTVSFLNEASLRCYTIGIF